MSPLLANLIRVALLFSALTGFLLPWLWPAKSSPRLRWASLVLLFLGLFALVSRFAVMI